MKKLLDGIVQFRKNVQKEYREAFGKLAIGQSPDTLFVACSDSRVVPNTFASTDPGDLFVVRNPGNLIPPCGHDGHSTGDEAEPAAIEFAVLNLNVKDIVVCGHSECGAMRALVEGRKNLNLPNLKSWLRHGDPAVEQFRLGQALDTKLSDGNQVSQLNVLLQMENIRSYPSVAQRFDEGKLEIHGWWFDIANADVYAYEKEFNKFVLLDENEAERIKKRYQLPYTKTIT